jgi:hypothetical protein
MIYYNFYHALTPFNDFSEFMDEQHFQNVPEDWSLIITDILGSTKAIEDGNYKEVNTVGAASIVVASKTVAREDFPFVFGGDGATLLIPGAMVSEVVRNLGGLKELAQSNFGLHLRVGVINVGQIIASGRKIKVAKYEITRGRHVAILKGSGISYAEKLIKENSEKYEIIHQDSGNADLTGLSCRWKPIPSKNGSILTILVMARENEEEVYREFLRNLNQILPEGIEASNPANNDGMSYKSFSQCLKEERKYHASIFQFSFLARFLEIVASILIFRLGLNPLVFNPKKYSQSMRTHSDFRKFDDTLRMVIDCSKEQSAKIRIYLEKAHAEKKLFFGLLETDNSLITCFVEGLKQGEHIHFIDADNGGYAMAAVELKGQLKQASLEN